jgi:outer membrane protein OmpA-like peptidoglycan-associated protein
MIVALATTGCATKKFVRQERAGVEQKVSELDKKQSEAVTALDTKMQQNVSRVEERAMTAENKATEAGRAANQAQTSANEATQLAKNATNLAQDSQSRIQELRKNVEGMNNYRLLSSEEVLFKFNQAKLADEGKQKLDQVADSAKGQNGMIIEVEGFTDTTGPTDYNLALSRRRADSVVRYLVEKGVPLRRIHMIGLGEWNSVYSDGGIQQASTGTQSGMQSGTATETEHMSRRERNKAMRKVVVRVWTPETTLAASASQPQQQQMQETQPQPQTQTQTEQQPTSPARP